ncbi:hypothetical protein HYV11_02460 [Candidatus Dependentiae bacterium]|nr:hypothetical protein [Candidatus Dependentiae bacterium]
MKMIWYILPFFCVGGLFFLQQESWIIITSPFQKQATELVTSQLNTEYKTVLLYGWRNGEFKSESTEIIYSDDIALNMKLLLNSWLLFLEDEHITEKQTQIMSVALSVSKQEAFISLNQTPFDMNASTYDKLMWIESLLKTVKENKIPIAALRLLVHHQPLLDDHLNFDIAWPISGFLNNEK